MTSTSYAQNQGDDSFQLYDLRVEVICPPGKRIMCGAKEGDYFTLEGEMLYLPPGQGISIYSLGMLHPHPGIHWHLQLSADRSDSTAV